MRPLQAPAYGRLVSSIGGQAPMGRITIDLDPLREQPTGSIVAGSSPPKAFAGWLELISRLEELTTAAKPKEGPQC